MTDLFEEEDSAAVGALSRLSRMRELMPQSSANDQDIWRSLWDNRGGFSFWMTAGSTAKIVILRDPHIVMCNQLLTGWPKGGYPKIDYVRSVAYDSELAPTGERDIIAEVTGQSPVPLAIMPIVDLRPYKPKEGAEVKYSFKFAVIKKMTVIQQLTAISAHHKRPLDFAKISISRGHEKTSSNVGDVWTGGTFVTPETLDSSVPEWRDAMQKMDFDKAYPVPDHKMAMSLLKHHVSVCERNADQDSHWVRYNEELWQELSGSPTKSSAPKTKTATDSLLDDLDSDLDSALAGQRSSNDSEEYDLSELDNILDGSLDD